MKNNPKYNENRIQQKMEIKNKNTKEFKFKIKAAVKVI